MAAKPIENENLAIVCEGYTDALACHRFGFHHAVATLGTAMTSDHARLLERAPAGCCSCLMAMPQGSSRTPSG